jgi:hypothetical protein
MNTAELLHHHHAHLADLAAASIVYGWQHRGPLPVQAADHPPELRADAACFVTLKHDGALRGCIGTLRAWRPLVQDVAGNAHAAAFLDPRFRALRPEDIPGLTASLAVLTPRMAMGFEDEADLLAQLRPGIDGLIIEDAGQGATFLPSVWAQLPDPEEFLGYLKRKAGLGTHPWSPSFRAWRYTTEPLAIPDFAQRLQAAISAAA